MVGNFRGTTKIFGRDGATTELQVVHRSDWTAEGQFILIQGKRGNDKTGVAVLWGYDPQEKVYRSWQFLSAPFSVGKPVELTGKFEGERLVMEGKLGDALVRSTVQRKEGGGWKVLSERKRESEWVRISTQDIVPAK